MKILTAAQVKEADSYTIKHLPIASIDLMEKAAGVCYKWIADNFSNDGFHIVAGPGNNGGDGLAMSRMLIQAGYDVKVSIVATSAFSADCKNNLERLRSLAPDNIREIKSASELEFSKNQVIIDALLGIGISRPPEGLMAEVIQKINNVPNEVISIDLPSGLYADQTSSGHFNEIIRANTTLTFQYLKPALLIEENANFYGSVTVLNIGLLDDADKFQNIRYFLSDPELIKGYFSPRSPFTHKGKYGHALLFAGGKGKMGAAILAARAALRSGCGLLTLLVPESGEKIVQISVPEAMAVAYSDEDPDFPETSSFNVTGAGPGLGTGPAAKKLIDQLFARNLQLVLDADALNILSMNSEWLNRIQPGSILTPHPGEFRRLASSWTNDFEKLELQRQLAERLKSVIILKGKNSTICTPEGQTWFNPTGNPGMAKGGSGDVLTGLITGLKASGLNSIKACIAGTWLHGKAGDLAANSMTQEAMKAGDIIRYLPAAWKSLLQ